MFCRPFRKHRVVPLAAHMQISGKDDVVGVRGTGVQKGVPHKCQTNGRTGRGYSVFQPAYGIVVNKQGQNYG